MISCRSMLSLLICSSLYVGSAFASMCVTQSHGLSFVSEASDVDQATSEVLSQCQKSPITSNSECSQNLACGNHLRNPYPSGVAACATSSHNIGFQSTGSAPLINDIVSRVLSSCQATSVTSNSECASQLHCGDQQDIDLPYPSGRVHCSTESHHILFELRGDANEVSNIASSVMSKCQANPVTVNSECVSAIACVDDGWNHPPHHGDDDDHSGHDGHGHNHPPIPSREAVCTTFSHNITFTKHGPRDQIDELTSEVLSECNRNPVTINSECSQNLSCR